MKITVFSGAFANPDSSLPKGLKTEYAQGLFVETESHRFLFDLGGKCAVKNLEKSGVAGLYAAVRGAEFCVLSHGHIHAVAGLKKLAKAGFETKFYLREEAFENYYFKASKLKYVAIDFPKSLRAFIKDCGCVYTKSFQRLDEAGEVVLLSNFKGKAKGDGERTSPRFYMDGKNFFVPDDFRHEQAAIVRETGSNPVLLFGGAHSFLPILLARATQTYSRPVAAAVGSLALSDEKGKLLYPEEYVKSLAEELKDFSETDFYFTAGVSEEAFEILKSVLGGRVHRAYIDETVCL